MCPTLRFDKLLEIVENDCNRWKSEARHLKVKLEESRKLIEKYQQNEIFNYNCKTRNQNLYKSRINRSKGSEESSQRTNQSTEPDKIDQGQKGRVTNHIKQVINDFNTQLEVNSNNNHKNSHNMDVFYVCIECDKSYSTKFQYNLHVLKDHKHFDISQIVCNSNKFKNNNNNISNNNINNDINVNNNNNKTNDESKEGVFRCLYYNCGKAFHKSDELKTHFTKHKPKIDRLLYVYNDYTNAVLNNLRVPSLKTIRFSSHSSSCDHKPKKIKLNSFDYKLDLSLSVDNYGFRTNGFGIHSNTNNLHSVPLCQTDVPHPGPF